MVEAIAEAVWTVAKDLCHEEERRRKDASREACRERERERDTRRNTWNLKEAVFQALPEAVKRATGDGAYPVSARTLYYQVRPLIQALTPRELDYDQYRSNKRRSRVSFA